MPLDRYMYALIRSWYLVALLVIIGLLGSRLFLTASHTYSASASVAVLEPSITKVGSGGQAELTFDAVVKSRTVAELVVQKEKLDISPQSMQQKITVQLAKTLVTQTASPLYIIQVKDRDEKTALALDNDVIATAKQVFLQLNTVDPQNVDAAFQAQEQRMQADVATAQDALLQFQETNKAWVLPDQISSEMSLINGLRQSEATAKVGITGQGDKRADVQATLTSAEAELARLRGLDPTYERLVLDVALATSAVNQFAGHANDLALTSQEQMQVALQGEAAARTRLVNAQNALTAFRTQNHVFDLPAEMSQQLGLVNGLKQQILLALPTDAALNQAIAAENNQLQQLLKLLPQYQQLSNQLALAQGQLTQLETMKVSTLINGGISPSVTVKVLDSAQIQPELLTSFIIYALGPLLGIVVGLIVVYVLAYFDRVPRTVDEVGELTGIPVLTRVPDAF